MRVMAVQVTGQPSANLGVMEADADQGCRDGQQSINSGRNVYNEDFEYTHSSCYLCNGYYGPCFEEPVCATCHAFLFPGDLNHAEAVPIFSEDLNEEELKEPNYEEIEHYLRTGDFPEQVKGRKNIGAKSNFKNQASRFVLRNDILHYKYKEIRKVQAGPELLRVVIDRNIRKACIKAAHEDVVTTPEQTLLGGHYGRDKTFSRVIEFGCWWPRMTREIRDYVNSCEVCQSVGSKLGKEAPKHVNLVQRTCSQMNPEIPQMQNMAMTPKVWHQISVDICNMQRSSEGFVYICIVVDCYSKWVEAKPLFRKNAEEIAMFLYELICRYGCARIQINDQGRKFCNNVTDKLFQLTGTKQSVSCAYHPQGNRFVERANHTVQGALLRVLTKQQEQWSKCLHGVLFALRTSRHKSSELTPYEVMYSRKPIHFINHLAFDEPCNADLPVNLDVEECVIGVDDMLENLKNIPNIQRIGGDGSSRDNSKPQKMQKKNFDKKPARQRSFEIGEKVLVHTWRKGLKKGMKGRIQYDGPYKVVECDLDKNSYKLATLEGKIFENNFQASKLRHFKRPYGSAEGMKPANESENIVCTPLLQESDPIPRETLNPVNCADLSKSEGSEISSYGTDPRVVIDVGYTFDFVPTNAYWRLMMCHKFKITPPIINESRKRRKGLGEPVKIDKILADGNCLFRAISKEVTLSEDYFPLIRSAAVSTMECAQYKDSFQSFLGRSVHEYLRESYMLESGTWGTEVEIFALATALGTPIAMYCIDAQSGKGKWNFYNPVIKNSTNFLTSQVAPTDMCIYLQNNGTHFDRILTVSNL